MRKIRIVKKYLDKTKWEYKDQTIFFLFFFLQ